MTGAQADMEAWFEVACETSPIGMGLISAIENRYVRVNRPLADLFGMTAQEILATDPYTLAQRLTHPDEMVAEQNLFAELVSGASASYRLEKRILRPDGTHRWALATLSAILAAEADPATGVRQLRYVVVQMVDLSEQKALAETLQRRETELRHAQKIDGIGRLAAGIAHDFNNLLTVMVGHAQALRDQTADGVTPPLSDLEEGLDAILAACARAAGLTAQVLAHGRRERVAPRTFVLSDAVGRLQQLLARTIGSDVHVQQALSAEGSIFADPGQVSQVVMNLVINARDAIGEGGHISLATRDLDEAEGPRVALAVTDDGHGMTPEVRARIFEPFFTTRTDRPGTQGTGLGLATVHRIIMESGGKIDVESAPGAGTTVTVTFPRVASSPAPAPGPEPPRRAEPPPNTRRVLVVEDEPSVRTLVANVLLGAHYLVVVARDGQEALRVMETDREPFDLIVTDLVMPAVGGATLARRLHELGKGTRMLFISGYSDLAASELAQLGKLLPKPFSPAQLLDAVQAALEDSYSPRA
jgi:PAS domain S-box-containing protein